MSCWSFSGFFEGDHRFAVLVSLTLKDELNKFLGK